MPATLAPSSCAVGDGLRERRPGYAPRGGAVVRNVLGGLAAMVVAYATGLLVGAQI
ncbi:MAG: hypothetical protein M3P95_13070 [Actinomycetota bacterium]|nr:hypothetical protein [Actinomycetota bacterium]